mgnify:FL=1|jgi:uncharacterized membrane protein YheB (UPF0754 family)|tara:strand:+ start:137 stop:361 length:225 start_codon:yes stop_codon:yes gene_type:complete
MATETIQNSKDIAELDKRMSTHEVMCDERWKTCFARLDDLDTSIGRLESIAIAASGTIIVGTVGILVSIFMMHS